MAETSAITIRVAADGFPAWGIRLASGRANSLASTLSEKDIRTQLQEKRPTLERLRDSVVSLLRNLIEKGGIEFLSIEGRTKSTESVIRKIEIKNYEDGLNSLTDLVGIRVVVYFNSQEKAVCELVKPQCYGPISHRVSGAGGRILRA